MAHASLTPGAWLDNMPYWEYGALIQVRDLARALREVLSRSQSQSREDEDLAMAEPNFNFSATSWMLPASESETKAGAARAVDTLLRCLPSPFGAVNGLRPKPVLPESNLFPSISHARFSPSW